MTGWNLRVSSSTFDPTMREIPPFGNWPATVNGIIELGNRDLWDDFKGKIAKVRQVLFCFELPMRRSNGVPFYMLQMFRCSMHTSANLYQLVTRLTGPKVEGTEFDPSPILGLPVLLEVVHKSARNQAGEQATYAEIGGIGPYPTGMPPPVAQGPFVVWGTFMGTPVPDLSWLPRHYGKDVLDLIRESDEMKGDVLKGIAAPRVQGGAQPVRGQAQAAQPVGGYPGHVQAQNQPAGVGGVGIPFQAFPQQQLQPVVPQNWPASWPNPGAPIPQQTQPVVNQAWPQPQSAAPPTPSAGTGQAWPLDQPRPAPNPQQAFSFMPGPAQQLPPQQRFPVQGPQQPVQQMPQPVQYPQQAMQPQPGGQSQTPYQSPIQPAGNPQPQGSIPRPGPGGGYEEEDDIPF
jgi:hypothetical protein